MKRNLGNGIVKKSIVVAMSVMLLSTSPIMDTTAAESEVVTTEEAASKEYVMNEAEKALVNEIVSDLEAIGKKQETEPTEEYDAYDVIDEAHTAVAEDVAEALDKEVGEAVDAAKDAEDTMDAAKELADNIDSNLDQYEEITDELLNNDEEIVESVEGNTDDFVETITPDGDILVNEEDEYGNKAQVKVEDYTQKQADKATAAADEAKEALNNITSGSDVASAKETIDKAVETAKEAEAEAKKAYDSAKAVLEDQIKRYNAYAAKYGLALYEYTDENGNVSTPTYTEEELANLSGLTMNKDEMSDGLTDLGNIDISNADKEIKEAGQLTASTDKAVGIANGKIEDIKTAENNMVTGFETAMNGSKEALDAGTFVDIEDIELSKQIVDACKQGVDSAQDALSSIENAESELIKGLENMLTDIETALDDTYLGSNADFQKAALEAIYQSTKAILEEYRKPLDQTHPDGLTDSYENRFDYATDSATDLAAEVDALVTDAQSKLTDADARYADALAKYNEIKAEYESYLASKATTDANFAAIEKKLKEAEANLAEAKVDCDIATKAVENAANIQKQLENISNPGSDDDDEEASSGSSSSSNSSSPSATPEATNIIDETVPLADVPVIIEDEAAPLVDAVPKTGDSTAAAGAVGATGLLAVLGALFVNLKKRTLS